MLSGRKIKAVNKGYGYCSAGEAESPVAGATRPIAYSHGDGRRRLPKRWRLRSPNEAAVGPGSQTNDFKASETLANLIEMGTESMVV